tara:strand:+ start:31 stop:1107 length:1077 start_codon:yes stop_codon:yes gene_type:complete
MFDYNWTLKDATFTKDKGTVFSCFACGGGSTMGYKLAGFDVIGCNEIDPKMADCYKANHNPKYCFVEPIQTFKDRDDLPDELYNLDILDGSPPCSSFSMSGNREKDWGKEKKFREGQAEQVLDTLFFDFIELGKKLQPKVIVAENVKGLICGDAKVYVNNILTEFDKAGYYVDYKLCNSASMGVPQRRERVFFYAVRKDIYAGPFVDLFQTQPLLNLDFDEREIPFRNIKTNGVRKPIQPAIVEAYEYCRRKKSPDFAKYFEDVHGKRKYFNTRLIFADAVCDTIKGECTHVIDGTAAYINDAEILSAGSYPTDYDFCGSKPTYLVGMSVPPVMTAQVATRIYDQWIEPINAAEGRKA